MTRLADADPQNTNPRIYQADADTYLAKALIAQGRISEARRASLEAVRILEGVVSSKPDDVLAAAALAESCASASTAFENGTAVDRSQQRALLVRAQETFRRLKADGKLSPMYQADANEVDATLARLDAGKRAEAAGR